VRSLIDPDPSSAAADVQQLSTAVLEDIATVVQHVCDRWPKRREWHVLSDAMSYLTDGAGKGSVPHDIVVPELFEWLFVAKSLAERSSAEQLSKHCARLGNYLVVPLLAHRIEVVLPIVVSDGRIPWPYTDRSAFPRLQKSGAGLRICYVRTTDPLVLTTGGKHKIPAPQLLGSVDSCSTSPVLEGTRIFLKQRGGTARRLVKGYEAATASLQGARIPVRLISPRSLGTRAHHEKVRKLECGLQLILQHWPAMRDEIASVTKAVTLVTPDAFTGGSDLAFFGVSFLGMRSEWSAATYSDHLVHEGAHHRLHAINELTPLLQNPAFDGARSPIRRDRRPLYGTLHATFVFYRLAAFFRRYYSETHDRDVEPRLHRHALGFYEGMDVLERHAKFTPQGRELMSQLDKARRDMKRWLPKPDPKLYNSIGNDYEAPSSIAENRQT
jgi:HEXXH motif-containing protein